jgi:hypothetical protein
MNASRRACQRLDAFMQALPDSAHAACWAEGEAWDLENAMSSALAAH